MGRVLSFAATLPRRACERPSSEIIPGHWEHETRRACGPLLETLACASKKPSSRGSDVGTTKLKQPTSLELKERTRVITEWIIILYKGGPTFGPLLEPVGPKLGPSLSWKRSTFWGPKNEPNLGSLPERVGTENRVHRVRKTARVSGPIFNAVARVFLADAQCRKCRKLYPLRSKNGPIFRAVCRTTL